MAAKEPQKKHKPEDNLIPGAHKLTLEEQSAGGKKSAQVRKERRKMADTIKIFMQMSMIGGDKADISEIKSVNDLKGQNMTAGEQMIAQQFMKALKGDLRALTFLRDTMGEAPVNQVALEGNMNVSNPYGELTKEQLLKLANDNEPK